MKHAETWLRSMIAADVVECAVAARNGSADCAAIMRDCFACTKPHVVASCVEGSAANR